MTPYFYIITAAAVIVLLYYVAGMLVGRYMARKFVYPEKLKMQDTLDECISSEEFTREEFDSYKLEHFSVYSDFGYTLNGVFSAASSRDITKTEPSANITITPSGKPARTVILVHGHNSTWHNMVKYFSLYTEHGYNIVTYNHRFHGDSGGDNCTAGFYEKQDLVKVVDWVLAQFPETGILGLAGESMGAATSLQYMPLDNRITFVHADCPYSDARELYRYLIRQHHLPCFMQGISLKYCDRYFSTQCGITLDQVSPIKDAAPIDIPLFLVHGKEDRYVPTYMSNDIYEARISGNGTEALTKLLLVDDARHVASVLTNPEQYAIELAKFLGQVHAKAAVNADA